MDIKIFTNNLLGELHVIDAFDEESNKIGALWFSGAEVAKILGYANTRDALAKHVHNDDKKSLKFKDFGGSSQNATTNKLAFLWHKESDYADKVIINESGLYSLIFGSKLSSALDFKRWVTHEVLPSIRKNGGYIFGQEDLPLDVQDKVHEITNELEAEISELKERLTKKNRLHKNAVAKRDELKEDKRHLKAELKCWKEEVNDLELQYGKVLSDLADAQVRLKALRLKLDKPAEVEPEQIVRRILVDSEGFLM